MAKNVYIIGQCDFDYNNIAALIKVLGGVPRKIDLHSEVEGAIASQIPKLILINRLNDADGSSGIELIKDIKSKALTADIPVMLVSNYEEAQAEAKSYGAIQGFGKSQLRSPETTELLRNLLSD